MMAPTFSLNSKYFCHTLLFSPTQAASVHPPFLVTWIAKIILRSWFLFWTQSSWAHSVAGSCGAGMPRLMAGMHRYSTTTVMERDPPLQSSSPAVTYLVDVPTCPGIAVRLSNYVFLSFGLFFLSFISFFYNKIPITINHSRQLHRSKWKWRGSPKGNHET